MERPTVILELGADPQLARNLLAGGVFVPGCGVGLNEDCELVVRGGGEEIVVVARVVWIDAQGRGAGLQLLECDAAMRERIGEMGAAAAAVPEAEAEAEAETETETETETGTEAEAEGEGEGEGDGDGDARRRKIALNVQERLRGLTLVQQLKVAQHGEQSERIVLERMYGKNVWEALLRNPRITGPEVARIARMGALPRPQIEVIVGNGAWLQIPEVRRALLSNPRLATDQILRVLRLLPKHELKLAASQTAYPFAVRDAAKRLLRDSP